MIAAAEARSEMRGLTPRALAASALVAIAIGAALPYVILTLGFGPNVSLLATFAGFGLLSSATRFELHVVQAAGVAAGQSASLSIALAAVDLLRERGGIHGGEPSALALCAWLASAGCLGVLLAIGARRHFLDDERLPFVGGAVAAKTILVLDGKRHHGAPMLAGAIAGAAALAAAGISRGAVTGVGSGMLLGTRVALSIGAGAAIAAIAGGGAWMTWAAGAMLVSSAGAAVARRALGGRKRKPAHDGRARGSGARWLAALAPLAALVVVCVAGRVLVDFPVPLTLASVALSLPLLFVGTHVLGEANWAPSTALATVAQAALAALVPGCLTTHMLGSAVAGAVPAGGAHLMQNLRAAKIVGATARETIAVQLFGAAVGAIAVGLVYPRLAASYGVGPGGLAAPLSATWVGFGEIFAGGALPPSCLGALAGGALAGVALAIAEWRLGERAPAAVPLAVGLLLPLGAGGALAVGGALAWAWRKRAPRSEEAQRVPLAAGSIAGEALAMVARALVGAGW